MKRAILCLASVLAVLTVGSASFAHGADVKSLPCAAQNITLSANTTYLVSSCITVPSARIRFVCNSSHSVDFVVIQIFDSVVVPEILIDGTSNVTYLSIAIRNVRVTGTNRPTVQLSGGAAAQFWSILFDNVTFSDCPFSTSWIDLSPTHLWDSYLRFTNVTVTGSIEQSLVVLQPAVSMRNVTVRAVRMSVTVHALDNRLSLFRFFTAIRASDAHFVGDNLVATMRLCGVPHLRCAYGSSTEPYSVVWFAVAPNGTLSSSTAALSNCSVDAVFLTPPDSIQGSFFYVVHVATAEIPTIATLPYAVDGLSVALQHVTAVLTATSTVSLVFLDGWVAVSRINCLIEDASVVLDARGAENWGSSGRSASLFAVFARMPALVDSVIVARQVSGSFTVVGGTEVGVNISSSSVGKPSLIGCIAIALNMWKVQNVSVDLSGLRFQFVITYGSLIPVVVNSTPTSTVVSQMQTSLIFISGANMSSAVSVAVADSSFVSSVNTSVAPSGGPVSPNPSFGTVTVTVTAISMSLSTTTAEVVLRNTSFRVAYVIVALPSAFVSVAAHAMLLSCQLDTFFAAIVQKSQISAAQFYVSDCQMFTRSVPLLEHQVAVYGPPTVSSNVTVVLRNVTSDSAASLLLCYVSCSLSMHRLAAVHLSNLSSVVTTDQYGINGILVFPAVATFDAQCSITVTASAFLARTTLSTLNTVAGSSISFASLSVLQLSGNTFSGFASLVPLSSSAGSKSTKVSFLGLLQLGCNSWNGSPMPSLVTKLAFAAVPSRQVIRMLDLPGGLFQCGATESRSLKTVTMSMAAVAPPPPLPKATVVVGSTTTAAAAVGAATAVLGGGGAVVAALDAQMLASFGQSACSPASLKSSTGLSQFLVSPFFPFGPVWSVVGNIGLAALLAALHWAVTKMLAARSRAADHGASSTTGGSSSTSTSNQFRAASAKSRFPNLTLDAMFLLLGGVVNFGSRLLFQSEALHITIGVVSLVAIVSVSLFLFQLVSKPCVAKMHFEWYLQRVRHSTLAPSWVLPLGRWGPDDLRNSYGRLRMLVHPDGTMLALYPQVASLVAQLLTGLPVPPSGSWCALIMGLLALNSSTLVGLVIWRRPERIPVVCGLNVATHVLLTSLYITSALSAAEGASRSSDYATAVLYLSLAITAVSVTKALHAVLVGSWEARRTPKDVAVDGGSDSDTRRPRNGPASPCGGEISSAVCSKDCTLPHRRRFPGEVELEDVLLKPSLNLNTAKPNDAASEFDDRDAFRPSRRPSPRSALPSALVANPEAITASEADEVAELYEAGYSRRKAAVPPNHTATIAALEKLVGMAARAGAARKRLHPPVRSPRFVRSFFPDPSTSEGV